MYADFGRFDSQNQCRNAFYDVLKLFLKRHVVSKRQNWFSLTQTGPFHKQQLDISPKTSLKEKTKPA
jgi:hypothetical protein